nr:tyrosine-protein kinase CSK-like [Pocillopora verrucosa]
MTPKWKEERDSSEAKHSKISPVSKRDISIIYEFYPPGGAPLEFLILKKQSKAIVSYKWLQGFAVCSSFPWRTKETKESNPSNNEKQVRHSAFVKNHRDQSERLKWSPGTKVVGMYDFEEEDIEDLSFRKGEVLVIEGVVEDINWYRAVNCDGRVGMIPYNFVRELKPVELKPMSWFHGNLSRIKAERLFNPREEGMFLIRNSRNYQGDYALSVCSNKSFHHFDILAHRSEVYISCILLHSHAKKIEHYRIIKKDDGKLTIDDEVFFGSLFEFVEVGGK